MMAIDGDQAHTLHHHHPKEITKSWMINVVGKIEQGNGIEVLVNEC